MNLAQNPSETNAYSKQHAARLQQMTNDRRKWVQQMEGPITGDRGFWKGPERDDVFMRQSQQCEQTREDNRGPSEKVKAATEKKSQNILDRVGLIRFSPRSLTWLTPQTGTTRDQSGFAHHRFHSLLVSLLKSPCKPRLPGEAQAACEHVMGPCPPSGKCQTPRPSWTA